ncbi:endo alpha-1,4 polygalactosaminidase [Deinococcus sp. QL22]|uniref:endo alpha-1,4 polygalactosaminidase n=1 Tax=Deinococcus sp. QL22 TaxID=2939437 RepID=UPI002016E9D0|nr:endo alpha-1,4 polygalactosaminidase [Deinococcus sp. QL22]UQN09867.1 endo alpha-1,4 polygalactosaminidase [Deinococcus sp. QL22]
MSLIQTFKSRHTPLMLLVTASLMSACGTSVRSPSNPMTTATGAHFEAEQASVERAAQLSGEQRQPLTIVQPGTLRDAEIIDDPAASGGQSVGLYSTGSSVRFTVPSATKASTYLIRIKALAEAYQGNPVVALRRSGQELARLEIKSSTYATVAFGNFNIAPGDRLSVVFLNGERTWNRGTLVDELLIDPVTATTTPTPAPVAPAPVAPAPIAPAPVPTPTPAPATGIKLPPAGIVSWDWQIGAGEDSSITVPSGVKLLDIDGFGTSAAKVAQLNAQGVYTVCYLDVGSYEPGRPDSDQYPSYLKIQQDPDWPSEYFLDVTDVFKPNSVLAVILKNRFKMCKDKGFAAIEPDNLQNDENVSGGKITTQQQIDFNGWVADQAHAFGLAVFQKNGPDKILLRDRTGKMMVEKFDGILNEQCQQYSECAPLAEYVKRGKLALNTEYKLAPDCNLSTSLKINTIRKDLNLAGGTMSGYRRESCN